MLIALLTTDNRENFREYHKTEPWFGTAPEALMQGFALRSDVTVHVLSCAKKPMPSPEKLAPNIFFHSLQVPKIGWLRTGYQGCVRACRRKIRELGAEIVHGQGTERDCSISAALSGRPNVVTIHGNMRMIAEVNRAAPFTYQWIAARLEAFTIPRSAGVVCISGYTERAVMGLARRTWVVPNAVDSSFFSVARAPVGPPTVLCVGHVQLRKNQNAFIRALDEVARQHEIRVLFLGAADRSDPYAREFFSLIGQRPWCTHGGSATRAELKQHLGRAAALALPSLEDNCPMVVLEAMAAGVPVMAANVGGVPELVKDGVTGVLCDPASPASMEGGMMKLIANPEAAERFGAAGREEARRRFHPAHVADRHIEIYRQVLSTRS